MKHSYHFPLLIVSLFCLTFCISCYDFETPEPNEVITTFETVSAPHIASDGVSKLQIKAQIAKDTDKETITFSTSKGTFDNGEKKQTVKADDDGNASVFLISSTNLETALVTAEIEGFERNLEVEFVEVNFSIRALQSSLLANGASSTQIEVELIPRVTDFVKRDVTLTASTGLFQNGEKTITGTMKGDSILTIPYIASNSAGTASISAKYFDVVKKTSLTLTSAAVETMKLSTETVTLAGFAGNTISINAKLTRSDGLASAGQVVSFQTNLATDIVTFHNITPSNATSVATAELTLLADIRGEIQITATTSNGITATTQIIAVDPPPND